MRLSPYHQCALHVLMAVAADGIAGEGKDAGLVGFKRHVRGLAGLNPIGYKNSEIFQTEPMDHITAR